MTTQPSLLASVDVAQAALLARPTALLDAHDRVVEVNAAFAQTLSRSPQWLTGRLILDVMRAAAGDASGADGDTTFRLTTGGKDVWVRLHRTPLGQRTVLTLVDVTAEWRMLSGLGAARIVRDRLLMDAEIGTWRYDPDAEQYFFSSELSLGHDGIVKPVPLRSLQAIQHPDDRDKDATIRERITREGGSAEGEMRYQQASGGWKTLRVHYRSGRRTASGGFEMHGVSHDVTELAKARDDAAIASGRLELAMSAANAGVYEIDLRSGERWTSEQFRKLAGDDALAREKQNPFDLYHPDERESVRESWERCLRSEQIETIDTRILRFGGEEYWVRIFTRVERDANGTPLRAVGMMIDIDAQKRQELALIDAKQAAEAATLAKSNFLASMSHEIRTPLNGILGMAQVLAADDLSDDQCDRVNVIAESGKTLMALLNDVLDISKIEAGKLEVSRVVGDLARTIENIRRLFQSRADESGLQVVVDAPDDLPRSLLYDPIRVRQCVSNLLSNAIKFTEHGKVTIRVTSKRSADGEWRIRISVADTGIGMDAETVDRLFSTFTQADASITRRFGGSGLGLAITRQLARLMGGDVVVESEPGEGSVFHLSFLAGDSVSTTTDVEEVEESATQAEPAQPASILGARVLLVDDNAVNRQVVKLFMAQFHATFTEAVNGEEALARLAAQPFDLVLLDVHMPVMDGREAIKRIRASKEPWADLPVIALTADAMSGDRERYISMGMSDYISKPIDSRELGTKVIGLLRERKLADASKRAA